MPKKDAEIETELAAPHGLSFVGDGAWVVPWAPARDLDDKDIERLVYVKTVGVLPGRGLYPNDDGYLTVRRVVVDDLIRTGLYVLAHEPEQEPEPVPAEPETPVEPEQEA